MTERVEGGDEEIKTEIVGRYALYREIASGGMATVHLGRLLGPVGFSRPVAIKRLHPQFAKDEAARAMFIDEARLASRVRHPNVVPTLDVVAADDQLLLVMEYVDGESLARVARRTRAAGVKMPLPITLAIMSNVLRGLDAAHEATSEAGEPLEIVHRDVSPQNVLVGSDGIARVLDFGIARAAVRLEATGEGVIKGKLAYMAPEQLAGHAVTRRADIYAASVILWELLTGKRLFPPDDAGNEMYVKLLLKGEIEPPQMHAPEIGEALDRITRKGLARDPAQRFATAREMAGALEAAGPRAHAAEIGEWLEEIAKDTLASRRELLAAFERAPQPHSESHIPTQWAVSTSPAAAVETTSAPPPLPTLAPQPEPRVAMAQRLAWMAIAAVGAFALGVAGARQIFQPPRHVAPASAVPSALPPAPPPPPSCPAGMVKIDGGQFFMGSDDDLPLERPAHNVTLSAYCIDINEATTGAYQACSDEGRCKRAGRTNEWDGITAGQRKSFDPLCNARDPVIRAKHPINCVDWEMATIFCAAENKRLPTEAEWEFAARGPDGRKYPWGDDEPSSTLLNACGKECVEWGKKNHVDETAMFEGDDGWPTTAPVGSFPKGASRYGLNDVVGNVWEWVADYYAPYGKDSLVDPTGPANGEERVIRGGAWNGAQPDWVRPSFRYSIAPDARSHGVGFRCARSL